jgi:hypothetical protein
MAELVASQNAVAAIVAAMKPATEVARGEAETYFFILGVLT